MGFCKGLSDCGKRARGDRIDAISFAHFFQSLNSSSFGYDSCIRLLLSHLLSLSLATNSFMFPPLPGDALARKRIEGPCHVLAATAATLAMRGESSMGNTDRQHSDSRASAEGKRMTCIKKKKVGTAGHARLADGKREEKERGQ